MENDKDTGNASENKDIAKTETGAENTANTGSTDEKNEAAAETKNEASTPAPETSTTSSTESNPEYRPQTSNLGNDDDGTPKISADVKLNVTGKKILAVFKEREGTNLPKITGTEIKKMARDQGEDLEVVFQHSDEKQLRGRIVLKHGKEFLELPTDINEEFNFGVDFEAMAEKARAEGKEWGEKQEAEARAEAEADEQDKLRLSVKKLHEIGSEITRLFDERAKTNLPGITEKEVMDFVKNYQKSVGIAVKFTNEDHTKGYVELTEFTNTVRVPAPAEGQEIGEFTFGFDYEADAKRKAAATAEAAEKK